jgi:4-methyl-5(b-hydroxyethyl)-thiazole monophosphate biosynthesis
MKKVLLFLPAGFEILEASAFIDVIGWNRAEGDGSTELHTIGLTKEVESSFGQKMVVDYLIDDVKVDAYDAFALPGGFEEKGYYSDVYDSRIQELIKSFHHKEKIIASICVGALALGKSGILNNQKGTTYPSEIRRKSLQDFGICLVNDPVVQSGNIITSCGPATAMEVSFALLEMLTSVQSVNRVKQLMGYK